MRGQASQFSWTAPSPNPSHGIMFHPLNVSLLFPRHVVCVLLVIWESHGSSFRVRIRLFHTASKLTLVLDKNLYKSFFFGIIHVAPCTMIPTWSFDAYPSYHYLCLKYSLNDAHPCKHSNDATAAFIQWLLRRSHEAGTISSACVGRRPWRGSATRKNQISVGREDLVVGSNSHHSPFGHEEESRQWPREPANSPSCSGECRPNSSCRRSSWKRPAVPRLRRWSSSTRSCRSLVSSANWPCHDSRKWPSTATLNTGRTCGRFSWKSRSAFRRCPSSWRKPQRVACARWRTSSYHPVRSRASINRLGKRCVLRKPCTHQCQETYQTLFSISRQSSKYDAIPRVVQRKLTCRYGCARRRHGVGCEKASRHCTERCSRAVKFHSCWPEDTSINEKNLFWRNFSTKSSVQKRF